MKAIKLKAPGGLDQLHTVDMPDPGNPAPGEIRVRIRASSLNFHDYFVVLGRIKATDGRIPMSDGSGVVEAIGDDVTTFKVGDHVVSTFHPPWQDGRPKQSDFGVTPGDGVDGYARECVNRPATWFTHIPKGYSFADAATLTTAGVTAWRALVVNGQLKAGETVVVLGTGGVSIIALQLAKSMGARVIATSSSDAKLERVKALGADDVINYKTTPDWGRRVRELSSGLGADHIVETGGPGTLPQSIRAIGLGGHISLIGVLTGVSGDIPTAMLMGRQARIQGVSVGSHRDQQDLVRAIDISGIRPVIDKTFGLTEIADAFRYQESGQHFGKISLEY